MIDYYGDKMRWFIADVIDASPPYGYEGRVRVRIHGIHNPSTREVKQNDLPWAQVVLPSTEGGVSGLGTSPRLEAGALVFGFFMDGKESQVPLVLGSLPRTEYPSTVQQSLAFQDLLERVNPDIDFYNLSIAALDRDDPAIDDLEPNLGDRDARLSASVKFFMSNNYTLKQACAIVGVINQLNFGFTLGENLVKGTGLMMWNNERLARLKAFTGEWIRFTSQLSFILYELNTTHIEANSRILNCDVIDKSKPKNLPDILSRYYAPHKEDFAGSIQMVYNDFKNSDGR